MCKITGGGEPGVRGEG